MQIRILLRLIAFDITNYIVTNQICKFFFTNSKDKSYTTIGDFMYGNKGHNKFCCCPTCKERRRGSNLFKAITYAISIIIIYQLILLFFFMTKIFAFLLLIELAGLFFLLFLLIF